MMVIDIRGTHGSGKSWIVHQLLSRGSTEVVVGGKPVGHYIPSLALAVVGVYRTQCGGCDQVGSADEVVRRVRLFCSDYTHVILEGILVAHTFKRYSQLSQEMEGLGIHYQFCFLNTPRDNCVARVRARRYRRGNRKPFNPKNLDRDWHTIWHKVRRKCIEAGHRVTILDWRDPLPQILEMLDG